MSLSTEPRYQYLDATELDEAMIKATLETYEQQATKYADIEWDPRTIEKVWNSIFSRFVDEIPKFGAGDNILVAGCGSFRDLLILGLITMDSNVYGYDITIRLLEAGRERLTWETITRVAQQISEFTDVFRATLANTAFHSTDLSELPEPDESVEQASKRKLMARLHIEAGNLLNPFISDRKFRLIFANACLSYINKTDVLRALGIMIDLLQPGAMLHFDLRLDEVEGEQGRIFMDTVLGQHRYYTTFRPSEIAALLDQVKEHYIDITVRYVSASEHTDRNKPKFCNIVLFKETASRLLNC